MSAIVIDDWYGPGKACVRDGKLLLDCPCKGCIKAEVTFGRTLFCPQPGIQGANFGRGLATTSFKASEKVRGSILDETIIQNFTDREYYYSTSAAEGRCASHPFSMVIPKRERQEGTSFYEDLGGFVKSVAESGFSASAGIDRTGTGIVLLDGNYVSKKSSSEWDANYQPGYLNEKVEASIKIYAASAKTQMTISCAHGPKESESPYDSNVRTVTGGGNLGEFEATYGWEHRIYISYDGSSFHGDDLWRCVKFKVEVERI